MKDLLEKLGIASGISGAGTGSWMPCTGKKIVSISPIDGKVIGEITAAGRPEYETVAAGALDAFYEWRKVPAPKRGEIVRQIGDALRRHKKDLGALVSLEVGKIRVEGEGRSRR
jgi:aldehyde dehydrogenase (NAD+)